MTNKEIRDKYNYDTLERDVDNPNACTDDTIDDIQQDTRKDERDLVIENIEEYLTAYQDTNSIHVKSVIVELQSKLRQLKQ